MAEYTLPHFGNLPTENLEEYYDVDIEFNGNQIQIDLNFETKTIDTLTMDKVKNFIESIDLRIERRPHKHCTHIGINLPVEWKSSLLSYTFCSITFS